jgi:hypothetical protein
VETAPFFFDDESFFFLGDETNFFTPFFGDESFFLAEESFFLADEIFFLGVPTGFSFSWVLKTRFFLIPTALAFGLLTEFVVRLPLVAWLGEFESPS